MWFSNLLLFYRITVFCLLGYESNECMDGPSPIWVIVQHSSWLWAQGLLGKEVVR